MAGGNKHSGAARETTVTMPSDTELVLERTFDAPRELVWKAWTDPEHLKHWWGPNGFTTTTRRMDFRKGGQWRFVMHGPDGRDYENLVTYLEIVEPERLVYKHGGEKDVEPVNFQVTVTFEKEGAGTKLTMRSTFPSKAARDFVIEKYGAAEGGKQHLARLAVRLEEMGAAAPSEFKPFTITRVFRAPRDLVFQAWTRREHLLKWFGPKGSPLLEATLDLRPGGVFHYRMQAPDGTKFWGRWVFREIVPSERLVFAVGFSDEKAYAMRHLWVPDWPLETLSVVTFADHAGIGGGTVVTLTWTPLDATAAERAAFDAGHDGMRTGWTGTFEQLEAFLAAGGVRAGG
jgi:uncharacterized protein YndB with AHSA1/START domain